MTKPVHKPHRKGPFKNSRAMLLSLPGLLLFVGAAVAQYLLQTGALDSGTHLVSDRAIFLIFAGVVLVSVSLVTTPMALFYSLTTVGDGLLRMAFAALNLLLLVVVLVCMLALFVAIATVFFNPA